MAMTASIFSINALSVELALDRRTITAALKDIPTDGVDRRGHAGWRLRTALAALGFSRGNGGGAEYEVSRAKWMAARAEDAELSLRERRGELVEVDPLLREVQRVWANIILQVRARFLSVPSRLASRHSQLKTPQATFDVSMKLIRQVLTLLAANAEKATTLPAAAGRRHQQAEPEQQPDEEPEDVA